MAPNRYDEHHDHHDRDRIIMSTISDFLGKDQPPRDRYGRYLIRQANGRLLPYTRATTVAETLSDRWNLERWAKRHVVSGLTLDPALLAEATGLEVKADKDKLDSIAERAMTASRAHERADAGTRMHALAEVVDMGETLPDDVTETERADLDAYVAAMQAAGLSVVDVEQIVIHDDWRIAGTLDRVVERTRSPSRHLQVLDLKTGASIEYAIREIAIQLAIYATASYLYDFDDERRDPMDADIDTAEALVAWLPLGEARCEIIAVDLTEAMHALDLALRVRAWRKVGMDKLARPLIVRSETAQEQLEPLEVDQLEVDMNFLAHLRRRAMRLKTEFPEAAADLVRWWPAGMPPLKSRGPFAAEQLGELLEAIKRVESAHSVPFGETWPPPRKRPTMTKEQTARAISALVD